MIPALLLNVDHAGTTFFILPDTRSSADSGTAQPMSSFYKNLKTMTKVEALRQAQLQLIRAEVRSNLLARRGIGGIGKLGETPSAMLSAPSPVSVSTSHPYFWAPFILVGEGR